MDDVKKLTVNTLEADGTMISLMGISASDPRIYPSHNADTQISSTKQAYLTYKLLTYGEAGGRIRQPILRLQIWARNWQRAEDVRQRILDLLDKKKLTSAESKVVWFKQVYESDTAPEATSSTNFPGKTLDFRVGYEDAGVS